MVVAGNAYLGNLVPELAGKSMPCGTQVIATEVLGEERARSLLPQNYCLEDCNYLLDYYRTSGDHRLIYGGGVVYGARDPADIERLIIPKMLKTFPQLADVKVEYTWTGNFLLTLSRLPQFGRIGSNIYYMQGYSGHGVTCTHLAGKLLSEVLSGQAERFDAFAKLPHYPFPGGRLFRIPFTAAGAAWYTLRDRLGCESACAESDLHERNTASWRCSSLYGLLLSQGFQLLLVRRVVPVDGAVGEAVLQAGQAGFQPLFAKIGVALIPVRVVGPAGLQEVEPGALAFRHEPQADLGLLQADVGQGGREIPAEAEQVVGHDGHHPATFAATFTQRGIGSEIDFEGTIRFGHHQALRRQKTAQATLGCPGAPDIVDMGRNKDVAFYLLVIHKSASLKPSIHGTQAV